VQRVIFPEGNRRDYEEVAADLKRGITPHFVSTYEQVYALALGDQREEGYGGNEDGGGEGKEKGREGSGGAGDAASAARGRR